MKYLINYMLFESIETYKIESVLDNDFDTKYHFSDDLDNKYLVQFKNDKIGTKLKPILGNSYELTYYVWDDDINDWSVTKIVNSDVYKTIYTIFGDILSDFLSKRSWVSLIRIEGLAKDKEREFVTQRTKLYLRYLRRNPVNGYNIEYFGGNKINLVKNKK